MKQIFSKNIIQIPALLLAFIIINYLSSLTFFRIDLTSEKRYTLSKQTKDILKNLNGPVYFHIFLDGDLPIGFKNLQKATLEMLDEFKAFGKNNIQYKFINPVKSKNKNERNRLFTELADKGIQPTNVNIKEKEGGISQKLVFPGAVINFGTKEITINLLENNISKPGEENLNNSIESLEYKFINAIKQITTYEKPKIAFIEGNGELDGYRVNDITKELNKYYNVNRINIHGINNILDGYSLVIIAKPTKKFNEKDKFILDQYLMNGGNIFWLVDAVNVITDSLSTTGTTYAIIEPLNIEDQLFKYGVRINPVLVEDLQCAIIPVVGQTGEFVPAPWHYFPLINGSPSHPVTKNLNVIKSEYINTIDTVGESPKIKKTVLLRSSNMSSIKTVPLQISISEVMNGVNENTFRLQYLPLGILLEGEFESNFRNRDLSPYNIVKTEFKEKGKPAKMVIVADGDIIKNNIKQKPNGIFIEPLGYDRYSNQTFGNKNFILNTVNYLVEGPGIIELRAREIELRLLDRKKTINQRFKWQIINLVIPCIIVIVYGIVYNIRRKQKYLKIQ